jgi:hypothetical protein
LGLVACAWVVCLLEAILLCVVAFNVTAAPSVGKVENIARATIN